MRGVCTHCVVFAGLAVSLGAGEKPAATAPTAAVTTGPNSSDASIEAAKRQFELLKSVREATPAAKDGLPRVAVPEFHPTMLEPVRKPSALKSDVESKSANWLVDAMEKGRDPRQDRDRRERGRDKGGRGKEEELTTGWEKRGDEKSRSPEAKDSERGPQEGKEEMPVAPNPLAPFLAQWMTPQDYALLGTSIETNAATELAPREGGAAPAGGVEFSAGVGPRDGAGISGPGSRPVFTKPPENPYLQGLKTPLVAPGIVASAPMAASAQPAAAPPMYTAPAPATPPKPKVPDFVKPQTEEKYFKQLKRF